MSTVRVGESTFDALPSDPILTVELPSGTVDYVEIILCLFFGATILRCFYSCICTGPKSQKEKNS